ARGDRPRTAHPHRRARSEILDAVRSFSIACRARSVREAPNGRRTRSVPESITGHTPPRRLSPLSEPLRPGLGAKRRGPDHEWDGTVSRRRAGARAAAIARRGWQWAGRG